MDAASSKVTGDEYTDLQLQSLSPWERSLLSKNPIIAPDGYIPNSVVRRRIKVVKPDTTTGSWSVKQRPGSFYLNTSHGMGYRRTGDVLSDIRSNKWRVTGSARVVPGEAKLEPLKSMRYNMLLEDASVTKVDNSIISTIDRLLRDLNVTKVPSSIISHVDRLPRGDVVQPRVTAAPKSKTASSVNEDRYSVKRSLFDLDTTESVAVPPQPWKVLPHLRLEERKLSWPEFVAGTDGPDEEGAAGKSSYPELADTSVPADTRRTKKHRVVKKTQVRPERTTTATGAAKKTDQPSTAPASQLSTHPELTLLQRVTAESWFPRGVPHEVNLVLDQLIGLIEVINSDAVIVQVCDYLVQFYQDQHVAADLLTWAVEKLSRHINGPSAMLREHAVKTLQMLDVSAEDIIFFILQNLLDVKTEVREELLYTLAEMIGGTEVKVGLDCLMSSLGINEPINSKEEQLAAITALCENMRTQAESLATCSYDVVIQTVETLLSKLTLGQGASTTWGSRINSPLDNISAAQATTDQDTDSFIGRLTNLSDMKAKGRKAGREKKKNIKFRRRKYETSKIETMDQEKSGEIDIVREMTEQSQFLGSERNDSPQPEDDEGGSSPQPEDDEGGSSPQPIYEDGKESPQPIDGDIKGSRPSDGVKKENIMQRKGGDREHIIQSGGGEGDNIRQLGRLERRENRQTEVNAGRGIRQASRTDIEATDESDQRKEDISENDEDCNDNNDDSDNDDERENSEESETTETSESDKLLEQRMYSNLTSDDVEDRSPRDHILSSTGYTWTEKSALPGIAELRMLQPRHFIDQGSSPAPRNHLSDPAEDRRNAATSDELNDGTESMFQHMLWRQQAPGRFHEEWELTDGIRRGLYYGDQILPGPESVRDNMVLLTLTRPDRNNDTTQPKMTVNMESSTSRDITRFKCSLPAIRTPIRQPVARGVRQVNLEVSQMVDVWAMFA